MTTNISIIGAGAWGSALAFAFSKSCDKVTLWSRSDDCKYNNDYIAKHNEKIIFTTDIEDIVKNKIIIIAVAAQALRIILSTLKSKLTDDHIVILSAKGIEQDTSKLMSEVASDIIDIKNISILSGPNFASELIQDLPAASIIANNNFENAQYLANLLSSNNFCLYPSNDIIGTQIGGVMKNIIAIACGITIGLNLGENIRSAIITIGFNEMISLNKLKGGKLETLTNLAGIGDLNLTCNSLQSRNIKFGIELTKNQDIFSFLKNNTVEGLTSILPIKNLAAKYNVELALCNLIYKIIYENMPVTVISSIITCCK